MTAKGQRNIIIVLMVLIIGILLFPEKFRQAVLEVTTSEATEARETGNQHASATSNLRITPKVANAS